MFRGEVLPPINRANCTPVLRTNYSEFDWFVPKKTPQFALKGSVKIRYSLP